MAQEDYLSGSQYGKVAGSLLASRNKTSKKNATKALIASALFETLGTLQKNQKTKIIEGYEKLKENYDDSFQIRDSEYRAKDSQRAEYREYLKDPDVWINNTAERAYNNIDFIRNEGAKWGTALETEGLRNSSQALYDAKVEEAKLRAIELSKDKMITESSFGKYNQVHLNEYKALRNQLKDDPTKKGLLKATFSKLFGYGSTEVADLQTEVTNARNARIAYEDNKPTNTVSPESQDDEILSTYSNAAQKIDAEFLTNFSTELIGRNDLKNRRAKIINTTSSPNYQLTAKDAEEIILTGATVPSLPHLNTFAVGQTEAVVSTILEKQALEKLDPDLDPFDFMTYTNKQIAKQLYNYEGEITQEQAAEQTRADSPVRLQASATLNKLMASYKDSTETKEKNTYKLLKELEGSDWNDTTDMKNQKAFFLNNVIRGKVILQDIAPGRYQGLSGESQALKDSIEYQLQGVTSSSKVGGLWRKVTHGALDQKVDTSRTAYVDVKVLNTPLTAGTSREYVEALNNTPILRKILSKDSGKDWSLKADQSIEITPEETELDYGLRYYTVGKESMIKDRVTGKNIPNIEYSWTYEIIDKPTP